MTIRGKIKRGKVLLDNPKALPEGTEVVVRAVKKPRASKPRKPKVPPRSLADRLRSIIGKAKYLPPDASVNHDHYLYGARKRK